MTDVKDDKTTKEKEAKEEKAKAIKAALEKTTKAKKEKKAKGEPSNRKTIDNFTVELLKRTGGITLADAKAAVVKEFGVGKKESKEAKKTLEDTTERRIKGGYLAKKLGKTIKKDDDGKYSLVA